MAIGRLDNLRSNSLCSCVYCHKWGFKDTYKLLMVPIKLSTFVRGGRFLPIKSWVVNWNPTQGDDDNSLRGSFRCSPARIAADPTRLSLMPPLPGTQANNLHGTFLIAYFLVCYLRTCDIYTVLVSLFSLVWVVWVSLDCYPFLFRRIFPFPKLGNVLCPPHPCPGAVGVPGLCDQSVTESLSRRPTPRTDSLPWRKGRLLGVRL